MSAAFVIDASLTMSWCFSDEATPASAAVQARLADETAIVPAHWFLEVTNVVAMAEKRKRISPAQSAAFLALLEALDIEVDYGFAERAFHDLLPLCRTHGLTTYDAAYLELAARRQRPLASLDADLNAAAKAIGVVVLMT